MARARWCGPEIYDVALRLVETCLRDGSLFSTERAIWTLDLAQALDGRVGAPIEGKGSFVETSSSTFSFSRRATRRAIPRPSSSSDPRQEDVVREAIAEAFCELDAERPRRAAELERIEAELRRADEALGRYFAAFEAGTMAERDCAGRIAQLSRRLCSSKRSASSAAPRSTRASLCPRFDHRQGQRARQDSNLRLLPPEGSALSTELRARRLESTRGAGAERAPEAGLAPGHRREDRHLVAVLDLGVEPVEEADVLALDVDVDEPP